MIALYQGKSKLSRLIRWWTRTPYSHAAWVCASGEVIEAWDGGVRKVANLSAQHAPGTVVDVFDVEGLTTEKRAEVELFLDSQLGKGYDVLGFLRFLFRGEDDDPDKWFCSELVQAALEQAGIPPLVRVQDHVIAPGFLAWSPRLSPSHSVITTA